MDPETYCGASDGHVHFNNQHLKSEEPAKLFGIDGVDERTVWLDMKNCSGSMDSITFSLLPNLEYINMEKCNFEQMSKVFAPLEKLTSIHIEKVFFHLQWKHLKIIIYLSTLESLSFDACVFQSLNKDLFYGLSSLKTLSISNCKISIIASDVFDDLLQLEGFNLRDSKIDELNFDIFSKLINLKFLSFHDNKIEGDIDYKIFEQLPLLNTIHFDVDVYKSVNFDSFPNLQNVKIGYADDEENLDVNELIDNLKLKNINAEYVFCGTIDYDSDEVEECC